MSKKQWIIELAMPAAFILMAAYVAVQSLSMGSEGIFPMMSAGVLFLCAVYLLFQTLKKQQAVVSLQGVNLKMVGITLLALLVYVFLLKKIGYVIDTFLLCAFHHPLTGIPEIWHDCGLLRGCCSSCVRDFQGGTVCAASNDHT